MGYDTEEKIEDGGSLKQKPVLEENPDLAKDNLPLSRKLKLLTAAAIFFGNITFGCSYNTYGPVLTSFQNKYETDDASISRVLTILTGAYMVGALGGGFLFNYINRQLSVIAILGTMGAMMILSPLCPTIGLFFATAAIMGLCCGSYDTAQFVWMMEMMQKECPPYVQGQHFFYAIGTILASSIMAPFLDPEDDEDEKKGISFSLNSLNNGSENFNGDRFNQILADDENPAGKRLYIPYTVVGCLNLLAMVFHIVLFMFLRYRPPPPEILEEDQETEKSTTEEKTVEEKAKRKMWPWPKLRTVLLCCCFYGAYQGMEMCTFQFFPKFGQNSDLKLSESDSTYVLTGMNIGFAVGRAIAIVVIFKISAQIILCVNLLIVIIANVLLTGWATSSLSTLWASSIMFGLGFSSSLMIVCGSGLASLYPLIVGNYIEDNPIVLSYTSFFSIALIIFAFATSSFITHRNKTRY